MFNVLRMTLTLVSFGLLSMILGIIFLNHLYSKGLLRAELVSPFPIFVTTVYASEGGSQQGDTPPSIEEIVDRIHLLESSRGKAKIGLQAICERQGKSNEYGYGGMKRKICFDSHEEAKKRVAQWVEKYLKQYDGNVNKTLCYYNLGEVVETCEYVK